MLKPAYIDLSHHNTIPQSLQATYASGIVGIVHKMTEGTSFVDPKVDARYFLAQDAGMLWGLYHFVRPGSMVDQAMFFVDKADELKVLDDNTMMCLDWEDKGVSADDVLMFLTTVEELTNRSPVLYSGHVLKEDADTRLTDFRLWLAHYANAPVLPNGWSTWWGWQYTDQGECLGVTPPTDMNAFNGTRDELIASWSGNGNIKPPKPPQPESKVVTIIVPTGVRVNIVQQEEVVK